MTPLESTLVAGATLRAWRESRNLTARAVALQLGITPGAVAHHERDGIGRASVAERYAVLYGVDLHHLMDGPVDGK